MLWQNLKHLGIIVKGVVLLVNFKIEGEMLGQAVILDQVVTLDQAVGLKIEEIHLFQMQYVLNVVMIVKFLFNQLQINQFIVVAVLKVIVKFDQMIII
jgi:hypothetical protein